MRAHIRGVDIFFDVDGAAIIPDGSRMRERPTGFLVNGGPGSDHSAYKSRYGQLKDRMQIVYFDHRGHGRSARGDPQKYTLDENVEDMEELRKYLGLGAIASIGASYGGMVAMAHAARYPESVSYLVLLVTAAHAGLINRAKEIVSERGSEEQIAQCNDLFAGRLNTEDKLRRYYEVMGPLYSLKHDAVRMSESLARGIFSPEALNRAWAPGGCLTDFDLRPELGSIVAPTLILGARHDWICAPEFSEEIHRLIPNSDLRVFEGSGHQIGADEPENMLAAIAGFLNRTAAP